MDNFVLFVKFVLGEVAKLLDFVMEPKAGGIVSIIADAFGNYFNKQ